MQYAVELAIGICALLIGYVYPFIAVFRGGSISDAIGKSWGMQLAYFIGLCFGVPTLGGYFGKEVADTLVDWVPEPRIVVAVVMGGVSSVAKTLLLFRVFRVFRVKTLLFVRLRAKPVHCCPW